VKNQKVRTCSRLTAHSPRFSKRTIYLMLAVAPVAAVLSAQTSHAAIDTWNGGGGNALWSNAANWGGTPISPLDSLIFGGTIDLTPSNDFPVGTTFGSITFAPGAGNFTLSGNGIILGDSPFNGGIAIDPTNYSFSLNNYNSLVNSGTGLETVTMPLTLSALSATAPSGGFHIISGGTGGLAINGAFTRTLGSTADFSGTVTSTTLTPDSTGIIGGWATFNNTDLATVVSGQVVAYTGYTPITGAPVIANSPGSNVKWSGSSGSATLASATTTDINSLVYSDASASTITMTAGQTLRLGATGTIFRSDSTTNAANSLVIGNTPNVGVLTAGGAPNTPGELVLNVNDNSTSLSSAQNTDDLLINAAITDNGTGKVTVVKTGLGSVKFGGTDTFTGNIYVNEGRIRNSNTSTTGWTSGGGTVYVASGAQAYIQYVATVTNNIYLAGIGVQEGGAGTFVGGAMRLAANGTVYNGNITLTANARITARGAAGGATINGNITGPYQFESGGAACGTLILAGTGSNYTGGIMISSGTTKLGANEVIPNGVGKGNLIMNGDSLGAAIFDLNGHSETVNGLAIGLSNSATTITNTGSSASILTIGDNNATAAYSGTITDSGVTKSLGITKIGTGTETLTGSNTYFGPTAINAGTLSVNAVLSNSTSITVASGATFDTSAVGTYTVNNNQTLINNGGTINSPVSVQGTGAVSGSLFGSNISIDGGGVNPGATGAIGVVGTTTFGSLTVNSGQELVDAFGAGDKLVVTGALTLNGTLNIAVDPNAVAGTYTILQYGSLTGGGSFALPVTNSGGITYSLSTVGNTLKLTVSGAVQTLTWTGAADGTTWDIQNTQNWVNGTTPATYIDGSNVIFNDSNGGHYTVNVATQVSPNSVVVNNSAGDYTISGAPIAGGTSVVKSGTSALTLSSANSYTGGTVMNGGKLNLTASGATGTGPLTIAAGTVNLGAAGAIGTGALTINGGTLDNTSGTAMTLTNSSITLGGSFTFNNTQPLDFPSTTPVTLGANITITINGGPATGLEIDDTITGGTNGFIKTGTGALTLFNVSPAGNLFSGPVDIQQGAVLGEIAGAIGTGPITIDPAGILVLGDQFANNLVLNGGTIGCDDTSGSFGNITANAGTTTTILAGDPLVLTAARNMSWTGTLSGSGNLILMNVAGNGSTTGYMSPDGSQALRINTTNASTFSGNVTVANNAKGELFATVAGTNTPIGTGAIFLAAGDAALGGGNQTITPTSGYSELNLRNNTAGNVIFPNNVTVTGSGITVINTLGTAVTGISASLGSLTIGNGQTLAVYFSSGLDHPAAFTSVTLASSGATFAPQLPGFGNGSAIGSDLILGSISEVVPGSGFSMSGLRKLILTGNNTFTGGIALNSGTIQLGSAGAFPAASHTPIAFGNATTGTTGILDLNGFNGVVGSLTDLSGTTANIVTNSAPSTTSTLTYSTGTSTFGGIIQDGTASGGGITALSITSGNLTLNSANTYTGNTAISGGALFVNGSLATPSVVLNGGTLAGSGTIAGPITAGTAAHTINPGATGANSVGTLTVGGLTTNANTTLAFDLGAPGGGSDLLAINGNLVLSGGKLAVTSQATTGAGSLGYYEVLTYTGTLTGSTSGILLPAVANNIQYTLDASQSGFINIHRGYIGDTDDNGTVNVTDLNTVLHNLGTVNSSWSAGNFDGAATIDLTDLNDVLNHLGSSIPSGSTVVATPEPASLGLLALGAAALIARRRKA
jgi:fibronectin-binding autotransporter adhesin